jgi:hypothetical protein
MKTVGYAYGFQAHQAASIIRVQASGAPHCNRQIFKGPMQDEGHPGTTVTSLSTFFGQQLQTHETIALDVINRRFYSQ